ncbi:Dicarboxylate transporter 2.1 chloroplastic [Zea mays]|uniref:Dicarboxylate transporter 2.1 chloroplastic n=1 Tax=Zea mays TaxID=4577 RepID=A0A1D6I6B4_MAIZE|nr:Dicarboxylate transporter 2.1 chloroplastic [Zea mays]
MEQVTRGSRCDKGKGGPVAGDDGGGCAAKGGVGGGSALQRGRGAVVVRMEAGTRARGTAYCGFKGKLPGIFLGKATGNSSALFLTAAAQNLSCLKLAEEFGVIIANPWVSWLKAASLPAFVSLIATPYLLKLFPPETKDAPDALELAEENLKRMGPVRLRQKTNRL